MKKYNIIDTIKILLRKRSVTESVYDKLKNISSIHHIRHQSIRAFLNNIITTLIAYQTFDKKPGTKISHGSDKQKPTLLHAA